MKKCHVVAVESKPRISMTHDCDVIRIRRRTVSGLHVIFNSLTNLKALSNLSLKFDIAWVEPILMIHKLWVIICDSLSSAMSHKTEIYGGKLRKLKKRDFMTHKLSNKLWVIKMTSYLSQTWRRKCSVKNQINPFTCWRYRAV